MHRRYIEALTAKAEADSRIRSAWLEGSFGRDAADRYADIDIHLLLNPNDLQPFKAQLESWLSAIQPVVLYRLLFDGRIVHALTDIGLRVDVVLHSEDAVTLDPSQVRVLVAKGDDLRFAPHIPSIDPSTIGPLVLQQIQEFWRCIALLPSVVGRNELITGYMGLTVETTILTELILTGHGVVRDRGVKNLNQFLPGDVRHSIEAVLSMQGLSAATLTKAHLGLARMMQDHGRSLAEKHKVAYPNDLEAAVLRYVLNELALLDLHDDQGIL